MERGTVPWSYEARFFVKKSQNLSRSDGACSSLSYWCKNWKGITTFLAETYRSNRRSETAVIYFAGGDRNRRNVSSISFVKRRSFEEPAEFLIQLIRGPNYNSPLVLQITAADKNNKPRDGFCLAMCFRRNCAWPFTVSRWAKSTPTCKCRSHNKLKTKTCNNYLCTSHIEKERDVTTEHTLDAIVFTIFTFGTVMFSWFYSTNTTLCVPLYSSMCYDFQRCCHEISCRNFLRRDISCPTFYVMTFHVTNLYVMTCHSFVFMPWYLM